MSKQTALQFFLTGLIDLNIGELLVDDKWIQFKELYQQAKAMEREQIVGAWIATDNELQRIAAEQYYEQNYGKEASHE